MVNQDIEVMIERAGRDKVFALVAAAGWTPGLPVPNHVWQDACNIILKESDDV